MKEFIQKLVEGKDLSELEAEEAMGIVMTGNATQAQIGAFLTALRMKGETVDEITAFARILRKFSTKVRPKVKGTLVDTCGAGGDISGTFNISTVASFVAAGAGVPIAKHGNRFVSSKSGSADVLEALGVKIDLEPEEVERCIEKAGIGFIFAPKYHTAMKYAIGPRKELGIRTVFNVLGPLISPAEVKAQVYGVYDAGLTEKLIQVLKKLGSERAMVVHGMDGLDEISTLGKTRISELDRGKIRTHHVEPSDFNLKKARLSDLTGEGPDQNAEITLNILGGEKGPRRDIVILNAAAAIAVGGLSRDIKGALGLAEKSIDSGEAMEKLQKLISISNGRY
ncbi:MAG: anthranilate phosphoribosyltransferase [Candidatus Altiarchaeota archaeon]|nr:anthranilate phosphoribosyltransferase [Candidatus Altiarchaeota archaeon]